ncbi:Uu.00g064250.m01.CDS01 [Anthostomella pinea]|uniref:Uu.00g064250.m01.CDS01 n=1 Tax=Anthostomella pinea TaxID=933095 RepID=A0AAI8VUC8_9PEZI|nr:Uu.00g064250.m01.CDS01 [Anthostomella pinea]
MPSSPDHHHSRQIRPPTTEANCDDSVSPSPLERCRNSEFSSTTTLTAKPFSTIKGHRDMVDPERFSVQRPQRRRALPLCTWSTVAVLWLSSIVLTAWLFGHCETRPRHSYETGFDTDLNPLRPAIELKKVRFTGGLKFHENGTTYRYLEPGATQYVGEPSEELDRAWRLLIQGQGVDLLGDEAEGLEGKTYQKPEGWWLTGADVFHQLHCVNMVREALRPDYYTPPNPEPIHTMHIDHCIDYLRQGVMCSVDLTMIPIGWSDTRNRILQNTEVVHTCRDFDKEAKAGPMLQVFGLRNYPLQFDQMEEMELDVGEYTTWMELAFMHWSARIDAADVEFVLAPPRDSEPVTRRRKSPVLGDHCLWILDFDCCKVMTMDENGIQRAAETCWSNDPFYLRPAHGDERDIDLWRHFRGAFLEASARIIIASEDGGQSRSYFPERLVGLIEDRVATFTKTTKADGLKGE